MTKQEFQEMSGLEVNEEQMWGIHEAYLTADLDKQDFCEALKTPKGAAELAEIIGRKIVERRNAAETKANSLNEEIRELKNKVEDLKYFLLTQSHDPDEDRIKETAIRLYGERDYYITCIEEGYEPDHQDLERIAELLRGDRR
jgi:hypothetical protein